MALHWLEQLWFEHLPFGRGNEKRKTATSEYTKTVAAVELNADGLINSVNDRFAQLLGARSEDLQGRHYNSLIDASLADSNQVKEHWGQLSRGESRTIDLKLNRKDKDGTYVWVQAICTPVTDRNGKVQRISILHVDLTALMNIRDEALKIKSAIENAQTAIMMVNRDFVVTYVNKETMVLLRRHEELFRRMWPGFEANKIVGTCIDGFHKNPQHQRTMLADPKRLPYRTEIKVGEVVLSLTVSAQIDTSGNYVGNTLEWADVTQVRKEAAETYADFQSQLNAISRAQAVIEFTLDGTIVNANENFLRTTGYSLEEIKGRHHSIFMASGESSKEEYRRFWAELREGKASIGDYQRVSKDGKLFWIRASYNPILDAQGKPVKIIKYATDITHAKKQEEEILLAKQRDAEQAEQVRRKVAQVLEIVNAVAAGDFNVTVPQLGDDAVGQVAQALSNAVNAIRTALQEVRDVAATVATAANELSSASTQISSGAQEQASSLEETASSLEEITSTVKQNTDNAQQARQLATGSRDVAEKGGQVVGDAVEAMAAINQSSRKIADIITTIDEIAFQTNLLALNAAVEAARAGEQGRGFAVVAAEVRNLAQRSASAAKEIKTLIQDSVRKVDNGTELVNRSGQTLTEIVGSVKRVTDIVTEIAAASKEQLSGIEQVNKAVAQMDRVTQSNATQTEEMSGTAEALLSHAKQLQELVSQFKLEENAERTTGPAATKRNQPKAQNGNHGASNNGRSSRQSQGSPVVSFDFGREASSGTGVLEF